MLLGQELKFKNKLCNLKLGTFFSALIRQSTEAESKLSAIYDLLYINPKALGKRKSMLHPNQTSKNPDIGNQGVT